jgi:D-3-phosphoglycerate dehydrogenase
MQNTTGAGLRLGKVLSKLILGIHGKIEIKNLKMSKNSKPILLKSKFAVQNKSVINELENFFEVLEFSSESHIDQRILSRVEYLWIHFDCPIDKLFLSKLPVCKFVLTTTTGLTHLSEETIKFLGTKLISLNLFQKNLEKVTSTAELAMNFLFHSQLNLENIFSEVRKGKWARESNLRKTQISSLKIGIVGLGRLGKLFAKTISGLGAAVYFCEIDEKKVKQGTDKGYFHVATLLELCDLVDIVSLHANVIESRSPILNSQILSKIKSPFILINTSRSALVDESAIIDAIHLGVITSYYTDVLAIEDDGGSLVNSIIWNESQNDSRINITPHIGGATIEAMDYCENLLLKELMARIDSK